MSNEQPTTKLCKHCKTEIPKDAKICPNCRKKQGGKLKFVIIAIVAIFVIAAIAGNSGDGNTPKKVNNNQKSDSDSKTGENSETEAKDIFLKGETAELNDVQVTLTDYSQNNGSDYNKPSDGNVFVLVEFEIANNTKSDLAVSSILSFDAYADDYSLNYSLSALLSKEGANQLDGTIAPGKKMKGVIGYEVPEDWENIEIHFVDSVWSSGKFKFKITNK